MPAVIEPPPAAPPDELVATLLFTVTELAGAKGSGAVGRMEETREAVPPVIAAGGVAPNEVEGGV